MMSQIPVYVPIIFFVLVAIGISRCFPRRIGIGRLIVTMGVLLLTAGFGYFSSFHSPSVLDASCAIVGGGLGLFLGWNHVRRWTLTIDRTAGTILVPGDPLILVIFLSVFAFKFAIGYGNATHAAWVASPYIAPVVSLIWSLFFGMTLGRNGHIVRQYYTANV